MENYFYLITLVLIIIILLGYKIKPISEEDLENKKNNTLKLEKELKYIQYQISEIGRISSEKTIAIKNCDVELFRKLDEEYQILKQSFSYKNN